MMICMAILPSCKNGFEEINTDPNGAPDALPAQLLAPALVNVMATNMIRNRNFNNELMQVTVALSDGDASVFRYEYRRTIADYTWNNWYSQLTNFKDIYKQASEPVNLNKSYQAIALICQVWTYSLLTDTYGDVPYFESNLALDSGIVEPKFDRQKDIYMDMFAKLEEANALLTSGAPAIVASSDPIYNGTVANWRRFGNSLYLRLLLRVSGKAEVSEMAIAKIKDIVDTNAAAYPRINSNATSAILRWTGTGPYTSPYMLSVRAEDFRSPAIGSFFIDRLRDWQDPRINIPTYGTGGSNRWGITQGSTGFGGVPSGYIPGTGVTKKSDFYSYDEKVGSVAATSMQNEALTGMIMNFAEMNFILAECAAKGWINGSAENFWKTGILNGITLWLPFWPNPTATGTVPSPAPTITSQAFLDYLSGGDIQFGTTLNEQMESIHIQKYYALLWTDFQQWFEYRRTGHPILPKGPGLRNGGVMPARMTYPVYVESANPTNYKLAVAAQGPDQINTEVWWQKP